MKYFPVKGRFSAGRPQVHAVDDVDLESSRKAKHWGSVGESGCGKTTLGRIDP